MRKIIYLNICQNIRYIKYNIIFINIIHSNKIKFSMIMFQIKIDKMELFLLIVILIKNNFIFLYD
jgi:hypothetical protein